MSKHRLEERVEDFRKIKAPGNKEALWQQLVIDLLLAILKEVSKTLVLPAGA